jgi:chemotaxis protein MotB
MIVRRGRRASTDHDEVPEYWITYSDLMVSLLMVFALLLFLAMARVQREVGRARNLLDANAQAIRAAGEALRGSGRSIALDSASGTLTMNSELLFGYGSAVLRPEAQTQIAEIATQFIPRLLDRASVDSMIQEIVIEGHTDTVGSYVSNLSLSQSRALSVMSAMVETTGDSKYGARIRKLVSASGRSEMNPIYVNGEIDAARSRRIEIHVRFRNDAILKRVLEAAQTEVRTAK